MMENERKRNNILIVGSGAESSALAKKLYSCKSCGNIYLAGGNGVDTKYYKNVDIREDNLNGLLKFVLENDISLTVPTSKKALNKDIVSFFEVNGQSIFGPSKHAYRNFDNKISMFKFLYKNHFNIPKFAVFNKIQLVSEYFQTSQFPIVVSNPDSAASSEVYICPTFSTALKNFELLQNSGVSDVFIQDYIFGDTSVMYFITDGYSIIPIESARVYKLEDEQQAIYDDNIGCFSPDYKLSDTVSEMVSSIAEDIISFLALNKSPYIGILGLEFINTKDNEVVLTDIKTFFQKCDCSAILNSINDDIFDIFQACANGSFSDEYTQINTNDYYNVSVYVKSSTKDILTDEIKEFENIDIENAKNINNKQFCNGFVITDMASTLAKARNNVYEQLSDLNIESIHYKKDIAKSNVRI